MGDPLAVQWENKNKTKQNKTVWGNSLSYTQSVKEARVPS